MKDNSLIGKIFLFFFSLSENKSENNPIVFCLYHDRNIVHNYQVRYKQVEYEINVQVDQVH